MTALAWAVVTSSDQRVIEIARRALSELSDQDGIDAACRVWGRIRDRTLSALLFEHGWVASQPAALRVSTALHAGRIDVLADGDAHVARALAAVEGNPGPRALGSRYQPLDVPVWRRPVSHFTTLRTQITDTDALVAALADMGYREVEVHNAAQPLIGYRGDVRPQRAHVIIRRRHVGGASNDIGFERQQDGRFTTVISDYDRHLHGKAWLTRLTARHAYHATAKTLGAQGFDLVDEQTERDGTVRLVLRRVV